MSVCLRATTSEIKKIISRCFESKTFSLALDLWKFPVSVWKSRTTWQCFRCLENEDDKRQMLCPVETQKNQVSLSGFDKPGCTESASDRSNEGCRLVYGLWKSWSAFSKLEQPSLWLAFVLVVNYPFLSSRFASSDLSKRRSENYMSGSCAIPPERWVHVLIWFRISNHLRQLWCILHEALD